MAEQAGCRAGVGMPENMPLSNRLSTKRFPARPASIGGNEIACPQGRARLNGLKKG